MQTSFRVRYFFSGVALANSMPHFAVSLTGRRNMTPFGRDSSPAVNLLWGGINFLGGIFLLRWTDRKVGASANSHEWLMALLAGGLFWSLFMAVVEAAECTHRTQARRARSNWIPSARLSVRG